MVIKALQVCLLIAFVLAVVAAVNSPTPTELSSAFGSAGGLVSLGWLDNKKAWLRQIQLNPVLAPSPLPGEPWTERSLLTLPETSPLITKLSRAEIETYSRKFRQGETMRRHGNPGFPGEFSAQASNSITHASSPNAHVAPGGSRELPLDPGVAVLRTVVGLVILAALVSAAIRFGMPLLG
jgi:hypothetical protein